MIQQLGVYRADIQNKSIVAMETTRESVIAEINRYVSMGLTSNSHYTNDGNIAVHICGEWGGSKLNIVGSFRAHKVRQNISAAPKARITFKETF